MFENKKKTNRPVNEAITASEKIMVASAMNMAGYRNVKPEDVQKVNNNFCDVFIAVIGDAMVVYTPAFVNHSNNGVKFVCF